MSTGVMPNPSKRSGINLMCNSGSARPVTVTLSTPLKRSNSFFTRLACLLRFSPPPGLVITTMALGNDLDVLSSLTTGSSASSGNTST